MKRRALYLFNVRKEANNEPRVEIVSDDKEPEIPVSTKKLPPPPVLGEYLLTA